MQYTGYSLAQAISLDSITAGLTGATGVEGVILSNHADFTSKNTSVSTKNTAQDGSLSALETKAGSLESGATGLEGRNTTLDSELVAIQAREDALLAGLTGPVGLEARAVGFNTNITAINANLDGNIQTQINTKVADSIFQSLKTEFEADFIAFQAELNQKVITATQTVLDARQDGDDAVLEKKFCSIEEFAQTFLQTYTVKKADGTTYKFDGKIQNNDKAPPIFSIIEKAQNGSSWDLKIKMSDYGYNVMSGNLIVKNGTGTAVNTLTKSVFDATTKLYTLVLVGSNSAGTLVGGPYTFEYQTSISTVIYSLALDSTVLASIPVLAGAPVLPSEPVPVPIFGASWVVKGQLIDGDTGAIQELYQEYDPETGEVIYDEMVNIYPGDQTGYAVSLNATGTIVAVTTMSKEGYINKGYVKVYQCNEMGDWSQLGQQIEGDNEYEYNGASISLNSTGNILAISSTGTNNYSGHVRVYQYDGTAWNQIGQDIDGEASNNESGYSVSLSSNGTIVAIGAIFNNGVNNGVTQIKSGHVRVYQYNGTVWTQIGQDIDGEASNDWSGYSVSLSSNGTIVAIGSSNNVRVYRYDEVSTSWVKIGQNLQSFYSSSVSLNSNGTILVVGDPENDSFKGQMRVYQLE